MFRGVIFSGDILQGRPCARRRIPPWDGVRCLEVRPAVPTRVLVYDPRFLEHVSSPLHVERPERLRAIVDRLKAERLFSEVAKPAPASISDVERVHRKTYIEYFRTLTEGFLDQETAVHPETFDIALLAAGATLQAARTAIREGRPVIALVRPPGHHAGPDYGGGFCYLNNVAAAAAEQVAEGRRVAILDYDAHHGNGTSEIFSDEASVLYISTHQYGIYPGTGPAADVGKGDGRGFTVNIPFTAGCGDSSYFIAYDTLIEPILREFRPEAILMSLGIDAHYRDPLTSLALSSPGYVELVARSAAAASSLCNGRLVVALEGGYHLDAVAEVVAGIAARFQGRSLEFRLKDVLDDKGRGRGAIEATMAVHRTFWNLR